MRTYSGSRPQNRWKAPRTRLGLRFKAAPAGRRRERVRQSSPAALATFFAAVFPADFLTVDFAAVFVVATLYVAVLYAGVRLSYKKYHVN